MASGVVRIVSAHLHCEVLLGRPRDRGGDHPRLRQRRLVLSLLAERPEQPPPALLLRPSRSQPRDP